MSLRIDVWVQTAGLGHVTRQIAFARTLIALGLSGREDIRFFADENRAVQELISKNGFKVHERSMDLNGASAQVQKLWKEDLPDVFVLDSVDHDRELALSPLLERVEVVSLVVLDDPANRAANADIVVNPLPFLRQAPAARDGNAEITRREQLYLVGKDFVMLAPEFAQWRAHTRRFDPRARRAFAFFGGADGNNFTPIFFDSVERLKGLDWTMLIGALYPHADWALQEIRRRQLPITPVLNVPDMARVFYETDLALVAAGNTLVEAAAVGTPTIAFAQNEIQLEQANYFVETCGLPCLGLYGTFGAQQVTRAVQNLSEDCAARVRLGAQLMREIDGRGAERVAHAVANLAAARG